MLKYMALITATLVVSPSAHADQTKWPALFREAALPKGDDFSIQFETRIEDQKDSEWGHLRYLATYTPGAGRDITILHLPTDAKYDQMKKNLEQNENGIWCDDYTDVVGGPVELVSETTEEAVFSFPANPKAAFDKYQKKVWEKTRVTLNIDKAKGVVKTFSYKLEEPVKPVIVAKVTQMEISGRCEAQVDGRPVVTHIETTVLGSAMGNTIDQSRIQTISEISAVPR